MCGTTDKDTASILYQAVMQSGDLYNNVLNNRWQGEACLDLVSALKLTSWLSFMDVFSRSACVVRAAFFSKAL